MAALANRPLLEIDNLSTHYISQQGTRVVRAVDDVSLRINAGETLGIVGEVRLRQEHAGADHPARAAARGADRRRLDDVRERGPGTQVRQRDAARARQADRHDPAGPDGVAQSVVHHRRSGGRTDPGARGKPSRRGLATREGPAEGGAHSLAGDPRDAASARDVGRHASAHRRRHRHLVRAATADRRRTDHQPRPDDPGAVPGPAARPATRTRAGADLHHPQPRHRGADVRPARGDVRGPRGGIPDRSRASSMRRRIPIPRRC